MSDDREDTPKPPGPEALLHSGLAAQRLGLLVAFAGLVLAGVRAAFLPALPKLAPVAVIVTALGLIGIGILRRFRYHWVRIKEDTP